MKRSDWALAVGVMVLLIFLASFMITVTRQLQGMQRAIACELALSPDNRTDNAVIFCFTSNGQQPPELP